jgi:hypothetical protein
MRLLTTVVIAALTLVSVRAQTPTGVLAGTVRDRSGGAIPGARVFAQTGDVRQQTVSDAGGRYRFELPAGTYRVEVELAGFRRTVVEPVIVTSAKQVQCDVTLRVGILSVVDYVLPRSLADVVPKADVVTHLRIVRSSATELLGEERNVLAVDHEVVLLTVVKGAQFGIKPGTARFLQEDAGTWFEDGRRYTGQNAPYQPGDEFVALLRRDSTGRLHEFVGPYLTFRVAAGKVSQQGGPIDGFTNGITLENFLEILRKLG